MLTDINPKLPMRDKNVTRDFYINTLGFQDIGTADYDVYLMIKKDQIQIHFFLFKELDPKGEGWNGNLNGIKLPNDDYWFTIKLQDGRVYKNHFALIN